MNHDAMHAETQQALRELDEHRAIERLYGRDGKLWSDDIEVATKVNNRLGWLNSIPVMADQMGRLVMLARGAERRGYDRALIVGMGGSSLWPEVVGRHLAGHRGLMLRVADSVHPNAIRDALKWCSEGSPMFVIATKSGGTVETLSLYRIFREAYDEPQRFVAITDPHSALERLARDESFWEVFINPPDIGGRFSATSLFGLIPAVLSGVVLKDALGRIEEMLAECRTTPAANNPGAELAAFLVAAQRLGRWHLRLAFGRDVRGFASWVEQLVAESTGKLGIGILPVPGTFEVPDSDSEDVSALSATAVCGLSTFAEPDDAFALACEEHGVPVQSLVMPEPADLWAEVVRWQVATALAGKLLGINPFDEPDVSAAKAATTGILNGTREPASPDSERTARKMADITGMMRVEIGEMAADDYLAVLLYVAPAGADRQRASSLREALQARTKAAVTVQFGPRYLHSTGQLHKGGPAKGRFVVFHDLDWIDDGRSPACEDVAIPRQKFTAGGLLRAQMLGDIAVLKERGKHVDLIALQRPEK